MRRSLVVGTLGALAVFACVAPNARACSCVPLDFYAGVAASDAVFLGEVLEISSPGPYQVLVTVRVEEAWKGVSAPSTTQVLTASDGAACGFPFRVGARYLIYTDHWDVPPTPGAMRASLCSRTHETWAEDPDLDLLKSPLPSLSLTVFPNPSVLPGWRVQIVWTVQGDPGQRADARLEVLDSQGRRVRTVVDGPAAAGPHWSSWDGQDERGRPAPAGIYWVRLAYGDQVTGRRLVRLTTQ